MPLLNVFDIAGSALSAESVRLNITSSNLANANSVGNSRESTYRSRQPVFETLVGRFGFEKDSMAAVRVSGIAESNAPVREKYQPDHPQADENGYIYLSNVNAIEEMANMISASRSYQNNIEVINTSKEMMMRTLTLGQ